jgi:tripeptide aminopeptidase
MHTLPDIKPTRLLDTFLELVGIDSPSGYEADVAAYCAEALKACGCTVRIDDTAAQTGSNTGNLIASFPGTAAGRVCLSAHMDTVEPGRGIEPVIKDGLIFSKGNTILGADDKVGIAAIIEALRVLSEQPEGLRYPQVDVLLTVQEERGLVGAKVLDLTDYTDVPCLVLDSSNAPGTIVNKAPAQRSYTAVFKGKAAHAGACPEKGISAIQAASTALAALPIGRLDSDTTTNVGTIAGGNANNVVAEYCSFTGECRSHQPARLAELCSMIEDTLRTTSDQHGTSLELTWIDNYQGFAYADDDPLILKCLAVAQELKLEAGIETSGGGADTNIFVQHGIPALSLATGMQGIHGIDECLAVADLEKLASFLVALIPRFVC